MALAIDDLSSKGQGEIKDRSMSLALAVVKRAEELGFVSTLIAERLIGPDLEAWILASAMIAETKSIELMVAVHPGIFHPQITAKMGASLDRISGGRFAINVVNGWYQKEFEVFGNGSWLDHTAARYERMGEFMHILKGLWCEENFSFDGFHFQLKDAKLPIKTIQLPHPPIYAASGAKEGMLKIAQYADIWFVAYEPGLDNAPENIEKIAADVREMKRLSGNFDRELKFGISAHVICKETRNEAFQHARALEAYGSRDQVSAVAAKALGAGLVGTPEDIVHRLQQLKDIGIELPMLHFHPMLEGMETFAKEIVPKIYAKS
jgi:FMNH2-dependent dimethyl sulfone monooxygenase